MNQVKTQWSEYSPEIEKYFKESLGIEISEGHYKDIDNPNYNIVNMMQESILSMFPYHKEWNREQRIIYQSLIELAIDNELKCRLEGKIDSYNEGHIENIPQRNKLLPLWCAFLGKTDDEIKQLNECKDVDFNMYGLLFNKKELHNMTFPELMKYCTENYKELGFTGQVAMKHSGISQEDYNNTVKRFKDKQQQDSIELKYETMSEGVETTEEQITKISEIYKSSFNHDLSVETIKERLKGGEFTLLRINGEAQGFIFADTSDKETYIKELGIKKESQNIGLGTLLIKNALLNAQQMEKTVYLSVNPNNTNAYYLYGKVRL